MYQTHTPYSVQYMTKHNIIHNIIIIIIIHKWLFNIPRLHYCPPPPRIISFDFFCSSGGYCCLKCVCVWIFFFHSWRWHPFFSSLLPPLALIWCKNLVWEYTPRFGTPPPEGCSWAGVYAMRWWDGVRFLSDRFDFYLFLLFLLCPFPPPRKTSAPK